MHGIIPSEDILFILQDFIFNANEKLCSWERKVGGREDGFKQLPQRWAQSYLTLTLTKVVTSGSNVAQDK